MQNRSQIKAPQRSVRTMLWCRDMHGPHLEDDLSDGLLETLGLTEPQLSQDIPKYPCTWALCLQARMEINV